MASYPQSLSRVTHPQMNNSKAQPKPVRGKQMGMQSAAARRLMNASKRNKLSKNVSVNTGSY
jgi:hypothetical protein